MCEKANQQLSALSRISKLTILNQRKKMVNSFIICQFFSVLWYGCLLQGVVIKESIEYMKDCFRVILSDYELSFYDML